MKKIFLHLTIAVSLIFASTNSAKANAIGVTTLSVNQAAGTVTFTLAWDNSWWDGNNWDAAWVFVKFRDCNNAGQPFTHGLVSTTLANHTLGNFQATNSSGTANLIDAIPDNTGILLRRNSLGSGSVSSSVTLRITNLPAAGTNLDVRVYAIEMVFIPQGAYVLGDGNGALQSTGSFTGATPVTATTISSEAVVTLNSGAYLTGAGFPKGYNAFYIMKYEISQGQYADFLNGCGFGQAAARYPSFLGTNRYQIDNTGSYPQNYFSNRPDRSCNYLSWNDLSGYLDWAALRPMNELQYEKACRGGGGPVLRECAWGNTTSTNAANISGVENGTETITTVNANVNGSNLGFGGGDGGSGPIRDGIFATVATTTRQQTGASYWGVMELTGNVMEILIAVQAGCGTGPCIAGTSFGDGNIDVIGQHNVADWPAASPVFINQIIWRGGSWQLCGGCTGSWCSVSNRSYNGIANNNRNSDTGGRGGR